MCDANASHTPESDLRCWCAGMVAMRQRPWAPGALFWFNYLYYIPIAGSVAIVCNCACFRVIWMFSKKKPVFWLQAAVFLTDTVVLALCLPLALNQVAGVTWNTAAGGLQASYWAAWWGAYTTYIPVNVFITAVQLVVLMVASLRLYALKRPVAFKNMDHGRTAIKIVLLAYTIGFVTCVQEMIRPSVHHCAAANSPAYYFVHFAAELSPAMQLMAYTRLSVRMLANACLVVVAVLVSSAYKAVENKMNHAEAVDSALLQKLLLIQAVSLSVGPIGVYMWYLSIYALGRIPPPWFAALIDLLLVVSFQINFVFYFAMSKQFRKGIKEAVFFWKKSAVQQSTAWGTG